MVRSIKVAKALYPVTFTHGLSLRFSHYSSHRCKVNPKVRAGAVKFSNSFATTPEEPAILLKPLLPLSRLCARGHRPRSSNRTGIGPVVGVGVELRRANRKIWRHRSELALPRPFFSASLKNRAKRWCGCHRNHRFASM